MAEALGPCFPVVYLLILFGGSTAIVIVNNRRLRRRLVGEPPSQGAKKTRSDPITWALSIVLVAMLFFLETQRRPIFGRVQRRHDFDWIPVLVPGIAIGIIVVSIAILWIRYRMSARYAAFKEADAGHTDDAIATMQREIAEKGATLDRMNSLGVLLISAERFDEALETLHEAERLGGCTAVGLSNQGIALLRLGRLEEAQALLERACSLEPTNLLVGANHCEILAELGRIEEAARELQRIEQIARSAHWLLRAIPAVRRSWAKMFDECRTKIANARTDQATPGA